LEGFGSVLDANLLGTKSLHLSNGVGTFSDLGLQGDAGAHFRLRFRYLTLTVDSDEFVVSPNHMFVSVHPANGQYGPGLTKAAIGFSNTVQARDGANNVLTGADNTDSSTDAVGVTVIEGFGSVLDANLLGTKSLHLSNGVGTFSDLGLQGDAGAHFRLRFRYLTLTVDSDGVVVSPNHMFVSVHPANGQYGPGLTKAAIGFSNTVQARDGANNVLTGADNTDSSTDAVNVTILESNGIVFDANLLGTKSLHLSNGVGTFSDSWFARGRWCAFTGYVIAIMRLLLTPTNSK